MRAAGLWQFLTTHPRLTALGRGLLAATGFEPRGAVAAGARGDGGVRRAALRSARDTKRAAALGWLFGVALPPAPSSSSVNPETPVPLAV